MATNTDPDSPLDTIRPLVDAFYKNITAEQWDHLKGGKPDDATKIVLAELFLNILTNASVSFLRALGDTVSAISAEYVQASLGDTLTESFALDKTECDSLNRLNDLVVVEVTKSVNSSLFTHSNTKATGEPVLSRYVNSGRLSKMIHFFCKAFKKSSGRLETVMCGQRQRRRTSTSSQSMSRQTNGGTKASTGADSSPSDASISSGGSCMIVETLISNEVNDIIEPILVDITDTEYNQLQTSLEIKTVAESVVQSIFEDSMGNFKDADLSPQYDESPTAAGCCAGPSNLIKNLFKRAVFSATTFKLLAQTKKVLKKKPKVESVESLKSFIHHVDSLLLTMTKQKPNEEMCGFESLSDLPPKKVHILTKDVTDHFYSYVTKGSEHVTEPVEVQKSHTKLYKDLRKNVVNCLSLLIWFENNQVDSHVDRVTEAIMENEPLPSSKISEVDDGQLSSTKKTMYIHILVEQLVTQMSVKSNIACPSVGMDGMIEYLFERVWDKLKDSDLRLNKKNIEKLHKPIYKSLLVRWSSAEMLLIALMTKNPELEEHISSSLKGQLRGCIFGFFTRRTANTFSVSDVGIPGGP